MAVEHSVSIQTAPLRHRITVDEYERMIAAGVWPEDERLELIEGEILAMSPLNAPHAYAVRVLNDFFTERLRRRAIVDVQHPLRLDEHSRPEPDVMLLRYRADFYRGQLPTPADVLLVIEVSDTTLDYDRDVKTKLYAQAGIPETWVVDLNGERLLVFREPERGEYAQMTTLRRGTEATPSAFPEVILRVEALLGDV